jgi:hypothetical protein
MIKSKAFQFTFALSVFLVPLSLAHSHHSFFAEFSSEFGSIEGEVVEVYYKNPHAHFYVKVITDDGQEEIWDGHGQNVRRMLRFDWKKNSVKVGDKVKIDGNLGLNSTKKIAITTLTKDDGTLLSLTSGSTGGFVSTFSEAQVKEEEKE